VRKKTVYFLYTFWFCFVGGAAEYHGARFDVFAVRPKAPDLTAEEEKANTLLSQLLWDFTHPSDREPDFQAYFEEVRKQTAELQKFPRVLKIRASEIKAALKASSPGSRIGPPSLLAFLATMEDPELIPVFESYLTHFDNFGDETFPASLGLGAIYKAHPEEITEARKEFLFKILNAKDHRDLARLHLRQNLPKDLVEELDEQVYVWQTATRPKDAFTKARKKIREQAKGIATHTQSNPARRALALQVLLEMESPKKETVAAMHQFLKDVLASANKPPERIDVDKSLLTDSEQSKLDEFVERVSQRPQGLGLFIHDGIQIENLLSLAREKELELDPSLVKAVQKLTDQQFSTIWNSGHSLVRYQGNSSLSSYAQAAMILSKGDSALPPELSAALQNLSDLRKEINPQTGLPRLYNYTSQANRKDATPASSAGRALTSSLAFYEHATANEKAHEAKNLLKAAKNFESHFSQLFELPANDYRSHDRHPSGESMATYYGFGNVPFAATALVKLSGETHLSEAERKEVQVLAGRMKNRLLNLMRSEDSFTDNLGYNLLTAIALEKLEKTFFTAKRK